MENMLSVRFAQSVGVGSEQVAYIDATKGKFSLQLVDDFRIRITNIKTGRAVYSSLFNAVSWEMDEKPKRARAAPAARKVAEPQSEPEEIEEGALP